VTDWEAEGEGELLTLKVGRGERDIDTEGVEEYELKPLAVMDVLGVVVVLLLTHPLEVGVAKGEEVKDITAVAEVV
jgi:hypothetical protein